MIKRCLLLGLAALIALSTGCRTGNYKFDYDIYAKMPGVLAAEPTLKDMIATNPDGSLMVTFDKGEMFMTVANGKDESTRKNAVSKAFELFHQEYMNSPDVKRPDGTYRREKVLIHGFVEDVELYIIEWKLDPTAEPNLLNDRSGNFM
jgi:hypothetical protein